MKVVTAAAALDSRRLHAGPRRSTAPATIDISGVPLSNDDGATSATST